MKIEDVVRQYRNGLGNLTINGDDVDDRHTVGVDELMSDAWQLIPHTMSYVDAVAKLKSTHGLYATRATWGTYIKNHTIMTPCVLLIVDVVLTMDNRNLTADDILATDWILIEDPHGMKLSDEEIWGEDA
jgi:hypothetical protein